MDIYADTWFLPVFIVLIGLAFGSFATAVAYRMPRDIQFITGSSQCPKCNHKLGILDLFPVLSWLLQKGRCRYCDTSFGVWYPLAELSVAILFLLIYLKLGLTLAAIILSVLVLCLIILSIIDFEYSIIPDELNITMFVIGVCYQFVLGAEWLHFVLGPTIGVGIGLGLRWFMQIWKRKEGLGLGDVKFLGVVGIFLQSEILATFLFLSGVFGILIALIWRVLGKGERFPFGPALALSLFICLLYPEFHKWWMETVTLLIHGQ